MKTFEELGIGPVLAEGLKKQHIQCPTEIQKKTIPLILENKDVIARSETGTGKTLCYLLPLLMKTNTEVKGVQAMVLAPTHELASQIQKEYDKLVKHCGLPYKSALLIGGASADRQLEALKQKPQFVVGSCGRILDWIEKRKLKPHTVKTIVLDEGDRLLDARNMEQVQKIIKTTLKERQVLLFSATVPQEVKDQCTSLMKEPVSVDLGDAIPSAVRHFFWVTELRKKIDCIRSLIVNEKPQKTIIFINNPENIEVTVSKLNYTGIDATGLYGTAKGVVRQRAFADFKQGNKKVLVLSDLGARGLDIPEVDMIINLDVPASPAFYLHRSGRTGRMGKDGMVVSLVTEGEKKALNRLQKPLQIQIQPYKNSDFTKK